MSVPGLAPDLCMDLPTRTEQALLYRSPGDLNPLHIELQIAHAAGFPQ
jgi:acyl dehydratase